jgi:hypothetical protein
MGRVWPRPFSAQGCGWGLEPAGKAGVGVAEKQPKDVDGFCGRQPDERRAGVGVAESRTHASPRHSREPYAYPCRRLPVEWAYLPHRSQPKGMDEFLGTKEPEPERSVEGGMERKRPGGVEVVWLQAKKRKRPKTLLNLILINSSNWKNMDFI